MSLNLLFQLVTVGSLKLKNRLVMAPMNDSLASADGSVTDRQVRYYEERAKGGIGLIITGNAYVEKEKGRISAAQFGIYHDSLIPKLSFLAETVHIYGIPIIMQLVHGGRQANPNIIEGTPVAPSPLPYPANGITPKELSIAEIEMIVEHFSRAAFRAKQAGFDGVEVHAAHGYLLSEFVSPATNKRTDKYGGSLEGRTRIVVEVIESIRSITGGDFTVGVRINGTDGFEGGITIETSPKVAEILEDAGVDYIHVSAGMGHIPHLVQQSNHLEQGCLIPYAEAVKRKVKIPVIAVGSITSPLMAENILKEGKADLIAMGRPPIADPELPIKAKRGNLYDIRTCIRCNVCISRLFQSRKLSCTLNPQVGREGIYPIIPSAEPKKIMIIGGGPAGMEAARVARLRGHKVSLYEMSDRLGGISIPRDNPPFKGELENIPRYYSKQFENLNVEVRLNEKVTIETVDKVKPDEVVVAVGGVPVTLNVPGFNSSHVTSALDLLNGKFKPGFKVLVIGAGLVGCETALYLASEGRNVILATRRGRGDVASDLNLVSRKALVEELKKANVRILENCELHSIIEKGAILEDREWRKFKVEADTVVIARGLKPNTELYDKLAKEGYKAYAIGDCVNPRDIASAISEGYYLGRSL